MTREQYHDNKAMGCCVRCYEMAVSGKTLCEYHLERAREYQKKSYLRCGKRPQSTIGLMIGGR